MDAPAEQDLIAAVRAGDETARNQLVLAFQAFAEREARRQAQRKGIDPDDAAAEMFYAICEAADRFDPKAGTRFATFLGHHIRGYVTMLQREESREGVFDISELTPEARPIQPNRWERKVIRIGRPIARYWPAAAEEWVRRLRRRNDRMIAKWLWLDHPPKRQAEIARRLQISRSAVFQRRRTLMLRLQKKFGNLVFEQDFAVGSLNRIDPWDIYP